MKDTDGKVERDSRIVLLDDHLISKIAAGEVIERPSSIVKELVENSIDALATQITVEVEEGGKKLIRISDDGSGMNRKDAEMALMRHATSKIKSEKDLSDIHTLGFRGEALASIVAVSRFTMRTKTGDGETGTEIKQEGKTITNVKEIGMPKGTVVVIEDLFFNTPARLKYLKSRDTELANITDVVTSYTLIYPEIHFRLMSDGKAIFTSPKTSDLLANIATIYGKETAENLLKIEYDRQNIMVNGYVSKPSLTRAGKRNQSIYVNRRYIRNNLISRAVYDAYHTLLSVGRHPVFIISIDIDPETIDVNVHPAKTEIRIEKENELYDAVYSAVKEALDKSQLIPEVKETGFQKSISVPQVYSPAASSLPKNSYGRGAPFSPRIAPKQAMIRETAEEVHFRKLPAMQIIGNMNNSYIIASSPDSMYLVDQHAACERINYEMITKKKSAETQKGQALITPKIVNLSLKDAAVIRDNIELLKNSGFDIEPYSENSFSVRSVPVILGRQYDDKMITEIIDGIVEAARTSGLDDLKDSIIKMIACKASVKAGERMEDKEIIDLLKDLEACDSPYTCPHGRPTIIEMTMKEIEKRFLRT